jgi:hypothetical protein
MGKVVKTYEARNVEAETLQLLKPNVRRRSFFGDDNHAAIDAQVAVLRDLLTGDQIHSRYEGGDLRSSNYVLDAALEARQWLEGEMDGNLVDDWKSLT